VNRFLAEDHASTPYVVLPDPSVAHTNALHDDDNDDDNNSSLVHVYSRPGNALTHDNYDTVNDATAVTTVHYYNDYTAAHDVDGNYDKDFYNAVIDDDNYNYDYSTNDDSNDDNTAYNNDKDFCDISLDDD